jgi:hypothetical protein
VAPQTHLPAWHDSPAPQRTPQAPQLLTSVARIAQPDVQQVAPPVHAAPPIPADVPQRQVPPMQDSPAPQLTPQAPQ